MTEIDLVAEFLIGINKERKDDAKVKKAIEAHNKFKEKLKVYQQVYDEQRHGKGRQGTHDSKESHDAPKSHEKLKAEIEKLKFEKKNMSQQIDELRIRLSALAGQKMVNGNPDIADLSDPYRPTKLVEMFREMYDEEWTHAFEELEQVPDFPESRVIDTITYLIKEIQKFCKYSSTQQIIAMEKTCTEELANPKIEIQKHEGKVWGKTPSEMNNTQKDITKRIICELRKSMGTLSVRPLVQIFYEKWVLEMKQSKQLPSSSKHIELFVEKAFEVIWLMVIQNPPMAFKWQGKDDPVDKERFTFYTKRGDKIKQTVWPAVLLHETGPLMSKGVVQAQ